MNADIIRAIGYAARAHAGQFRKGSKELPYIVHPIEVAQLLAKAGARDKVIMAGALHDVVEDCHGYCFDDIVGEFGSVVASLVDELTMSGLDKPGKIEAARNFSIAARYIKTADLTSNMLGLVEQPDAMSAAGRCNYRHYALEMKAAMGPTCEFLDVAFDLAYYNICKSLEG